MSLIVLEGTDGSGKTTQMSALREWISREGIPCGFLNFPRYDKPSGALAKQYLNGAFGGKPGDVSPYAASVFYAVDRVASYLEDWRQEHLDGRLFITDRYTTSNAVHQAAKLMPGQRPEFFDWLFTLEYRYLELPKPDLVLYLDMPPDLAQRLMQSRNGAGDIHESDIAYMRTCRDCALQAASLYGWHTISCAEQGRLRSPNEIHGDIANAVRTLLNS